jgi:Ca2+-binding EF-hand superfamily protein
MVEALDANQDGVIDAAEVARAGEALKKLDANGDGKLTEEEFRPGPPPR